MIKRRYGDDFATQLSANLEIKAIEIVRKDNKGGRRKPRENRENKGERKPREQREQQPKEEKKEEKVAE
jgi:hypothetical protein